MLSSETERVCCVGRSSRLGSGGNWSAFDIPHRRKNLPSPSPVPTLVASVLGIRRDRGTMASFKNDGSFLEMFRKMQEEQQGKGASTPSSSASAPALKPPAPTAPSSTATAHGSSSAKPTTMAPVKISLNKRPFAKPAVSATATAGLLLVIMSSVRPPSEHAVTVQCHPP